MAYYHCSPTPGIRILEPRSPGWFDKPKGVYMATLLPTVLFYGVQNFEYAYGYTKDGRLYYEEYFPHALEILYGGKAASLYTCAPDSVASTRIPYEAVSEKPVRVLSEQRIPDLLEALLEQEKRGNVTLFHYEDLSKSGLSWIHDTILGIIRDLTPQERTGSKGDYYRKNYPDLWQEAGF